MINKREIRRQLKTLGAKVVFIQRRDFRKDALLDNPSLVYHITDIEYDLDEIKYTVERDGFDLVHILLEPKSYYTYYEKLTSDQPLQWTEGEINYFRKSMGYCSTWSVEAREEVARYLNHENINFQITEEQSEKGIDWLLSSQLKKSGEIRKAKTVFIDESDVDILKNFSHFRLVGFQGIDYSLFSGGYYNYAPVYRCIAKNGDYFDYNPVAFITPDILDRGTIELKRGA